MSYSFFRVVKLIEIIKNTTILKLLFECLKHCKTGSPIFAFDLSSDISYRKGISLFDFFRVDKLIAERNMHVI